MTAEKRGSFCDYSHVCSTNTKSDTFTLSQHTYTIQMDSMNSMTVHTYKYRTYTILCYKSSFH